MAFDLDTDTHTDKPSTVRQTSSDAHDFDAQCLRILRCTAKDMAASPGGLRYRPGARPWLDGLPVAGAMLADAQQRFSRASYSDALN